MDNIIEPDIDYDFSKLYLGPPSTINGGAYFTRILSHNRPIFIQTPKSLTKQGFIKSGKKVYTDLMFDNNDTVFIQWMENLESKCQELIFSKGQSWFETKLEKDDIESAFTSPFKIFKSGKYYLLRVNVKQNIKIYNENDDIITTDDIHDKPIISILEIQGIKFTSRNFQIEIELKQAMVVSPDPFLDVCFIKKPLKNANTITAAPEVEADVEEKTEDGDALIGSLEIDKFVSDTVADLVTESNQSHTNNSLEDVNFQVDTDILTVEDTTTQKEGIEEEEKTQAEKTQAEKTQAEKTQADNIILDIEDLDIVEETPENINELKEVNLDSNLENLETIALKKPNQVYYEIYQKAREKAKDAKKVAITAYLEMKNIKKTYMLDDIDDSDNDSEIDDFSNNDISDTESLADSF